METQWPESILITSCRHDSWVLMFMLTWCVAETLSGGDQQYKHYHEFTGFFFPKPISFIPQAKRLSPGFAHFKYSLPDGDLLKVSTISIQLGVTTPSLHSLCRQVELSSPKSKNKANLLRILFLLYSKQSMVPELGTYCRQLEHSPSRASGFALRWLSMLPVTLAWISENRN